MNSEINTLRSTLATNTGGDGAPQFDRPFFEDGPPDAPTDLAQAGAAVNGGSVEITGDGQTAGDTITLYSVGTVVGSGTVAVDGTFDITTTATFADGNYTFTATAVGSDGLTGGSAFVDVAVDPSAPTSLAQAGTAVNGGSVEITGGGETVGDAITLYSGGTVVGSGMVTWGGGFDILTEASFADGGYTLSATETDGAGLTSAAANVGVSVDPAAPTSLAQAGTAVSGGFVEITGSGETIGDAITIETSGTVVGTGTVAADGTFDISTSTTGATFADGDYTFTAAETDGADLTSASTTVAVTVEPGAPVIASVMDPPVAWRRFTVTGSGVAGDTVTLYADDGAVMLGSGVIGEAGTFSIFTSATLGDGDHTVTATQTDPADLVGPSSGAFSFVVDPSVPLFTSVIGRPTSGGGIEIRGVAEAGDTITLYSAGTVVGAGTVTSGGTFDIATTTTFADGKYTLTATATDSLGLVSPTNLGKPVSVLPDAPVLTGLVSQPLPGGKIEVEVTGEAGDTVAVYSATKVVGTGTVTSGGTVDITTTTDFADGSFILTAKETDAVGLVSLVGGALDVSIDPPQPDLTAAVGQPIDAGKIKVKGVGTAGETITIYDGATVVGSARAGAGGVYALNTTTTFADGYVTLTAMDTDKAGLSSTASASLTVAVDPKAPTLTGVVGARTTGGAIEVTGTAEAGETVTLYDDGGQIWTGTISAASFDILTTATYTKGANALTAKESDAAGLASALSKALGVTVTTVRTPAARAGEGMAGGARAALFTQLTAVGLAGTAGSAMAWSEKPGAGTRLGNHPLLAAR